LFLLFSFKEVAMNTSTKSMLTISHLYGSGGSLIARDLGRRLHWAVWDKEIVHQIASQQQVPEAYVDTKDERVDSFIKRRVRLFGLGWFESTYNIPPPLWLNDTQLARMTRAIIEDVAKEGHAIIVGRGGQCILAGRPEVLHVFVFAPLAVRVERVMQAEGLTRAEAERRIAGMDRLRADYVRTFYHADWRDPSHYHLLVDSGVWGEGGTADLIAWTLERLP
jgi:cytidylate kinase